PHKMAVLDREVRGEGLAPQNSDGINLLSGAEIDDYPLRITRILLAGEVLIKIRITLPKTLGIAIVNTRIPIVVCLINRIAAPWQPIAIACLNRLAGPAVRNPITLVVRRIAPASAGIPMPRFTGKFGPQTVGERLKARRKHRL